MNNIDYLLYDNVTKKNASRDWGLKATTGRCDEATIKTVFQRYARDVLTNLTKTNCLFSELDGLIGGFSPLNTGNYILCITVSLQDHAERDSLAIIGLFFESMSNVKIFLKLNDPVATAKQLFNDTERPNYLTAKSRGYNYNQQPVSISFQIKPNIIKFIDKKTTYNQAVNILLNTTKTINILTPTCNFDPDAWKGNNYDIVFLIIKNKTTEDKLKNYLNYEKTNIKKEYSEEINNWHNFPIIISAVVAIFLLVFVITQCSGRKDKEDVITPISDDSSTQEIIKQDKIKTNESDTTLLKKILAIDESVEKLASIKDSFSYKIVHELKILDEYEENKNDVMNEFDNLSKWKNQLQEKSFSYYSNKTLDENVQKKILDKYNELKKLTPFCKHIKNEFDFEFDDPNSIIKQWCDVADEFKNIHE